jgi:uncharacterized Tic20 family protein
MNAAIDQSASPNDRKLAYIAHLGPVVAAVLSIWIANEFLNFRLAGIGGMLFALVFWIIKKNDSGFIRKHAAEAFNFNLSMFLYALAMLVLWEITDGMLFLILFPLAMVQLVLWVFCPVLAAKAESQGRPYRYPITLRPLS